MKKFKPIMLLHFLILSFLLLDLISLGSCRNKQKSEWEKAKQENSISSYEEFLKQYPRSKFAEEALSKIEGFKERHPSFRDAKRARIFFELTYNNKVKKLPPQDIIYDISWFLKNAEVEVISGEGEYDFAIRVNATGKALSINYFDEMSRFALNAGSGVPYYTGVDLNGIILFESKDGYEMSEKFTTRIDPPEQFQVDKGSNQYRTPDDAPYGLALRRGSLKTIARLTYTSFGLRPLIFALHIPSFQDVCKDVLDEIKPNWRESSDAKNVVPELISELKNEKDDVQWDAIWVLGEIKDTRAVEPLIYNITKEQDHPHDHVAVAEALGKIKDPRAIEPLISILNDPNDKWAAAEALKKITGLNFGEEEQYEWQRWWVKNKATYLK
jgi:hypothetical protein